MGGDVIQYILLAALEEVAKDGSYFIIKLLGYAALVAFMLWIFDRNNFRGDDSENGEDDDSENGEDNDDTNDNNDIPESSETPDTDNSLSPSAFIDSLFASIGCTLEKIEDDGVRSVKFHDHSFQYSPLGESGMIHIIYPVFYTAPSFDIEETAAVKQAVNETNKGSDSSLIFYDDGEELMVSAHSYIPLYSECRDAEGYLRMVMYDFFGANVSFAEELEKVKAQYHQDDSHNTN